MDPREYPLVPHLEDAVRGKIRRVLMAGRDFRDLPEQEGRFIVIGRRELRWGNLLCLKKGDESSLYVHDGRKITRLSLNDVLPWVFDVLAAALLSHESH